MNIMWADDDDDEQLVAFMISRYYSVDTVNAFFNQPTW